MRNAQFVTEIGQNISLAALFQTDEASRYPVENRLIVRNCTVTKGGIIFSFDYGQAYLGADHRQRERDSLAFA
jgi:hypothetical protein